MSRHVKLSDLRFTNFVDEYKDDVTRFNRRQFFNWMAVLKEASLSPLFYLIVSVLCFVLWSTCFANIHTAVVAAFLLTCFITVSFMMLFIQFHGDYDGAFYPKKVVKDPKGLYIIALDTKRTPVAIAGTIAIEAKSERNSGRIARFCVSGDYRGIGLGRRLLSMALEHCNTVGFDSIETECWQAYSLISVHEIFRRAGFEDINMEYMPQYVPFFRTWNMKKNIQKMR